jgi:hypothetical protein
VEFESKMLSLLCLPISQEKGIDRGRRDNSYYDRERRVRRWFLEVIITCYQMTGLVEVGRFGTASALCSRTVAGGFSAASANEKFKRKADTVFVE